MSWDVCLQIDTGAEDLVTVEDVGNMTYNVAPMYSRAIDIGSFSKTFDGMKATDALPILERGISNMEEEPEIYEEMNPANNWGSYDSALEYLKTFAKACKTHPKTIIMVC